MITYPTDLPAPPFPADRWDYTFTNTTSAEDVEGVTQCDITVALDAPDADTAERRALAIHVYDYEDDNPPGETATATDLGNGRWSVVLHWEFVDA